MRRSEFLSSVTHHFGPQYGQAVLRDLSLPDLGSRTADEALAAGEDPQRIWDALMVELRLPENLRFPHRAGDTPRH